MAAQLPEQPTAEQLERDREHRRRQRADKWESIGERIGPDYAAAKLSAWRHHGTTDEQGLQKQVLSQLTAYLDGLRDHVTQGTNLVCMGPMGSGKDFLLSCAMKYAVLSWGLDVTWRNGTALFAEFREAMSPTAEYGEAYLLRNLIAAPILAISDPLPPIGALTEFQASTLFTILDGRYRARRPTWLTINVLNRAEAQSRMGSQLVDRLAHRSVSLFCNWGSFRDFERKEAAK